MAKTAKYVYVTAIEREGQDNILDIFSSYEKAKDFIIEEANRSIVNLENEMYVEKVYEKDGERCTYGVFWNQEEDEDFDIEEYEYRHRLYVYRKELK